MEVTDAFEIRAISVGKFMGYGCDSWKCREFLHILNNLAPYMQGNG
jgi:hypothetical protein